MSELIHKLIKGSLFGTLNLLAIVVISFFMMPFVIKVLGDRWYGLWIFAASIVGYYGFLDIGLSGAVQKYVSQALGMKDVEEVNKLFNTSLFMYSASGILVLFVSIVVVLICPHFVDDPNVINTFRIVIFLIGIDVAISFPVRAFVGLLCSNIRHDIVGIIDICKLLLRTVLIIFFLKKGYGIIALAAINLFVDSIQSLVTVIFTILRFRDIQLHIFYIKKDSIRKLFSYGIFSFIAAISNRVRFNTDNFVISAYLGLGFVTHYSIGARIANYYSQLVNTATDVIFPVFSKLEGQKEFGQIRKKYILMMKLTSIFSVFIGGAVIIFGKAFITRWMGTDYLDAYSILIILIVGMLFYSIQGISAKVLLSLSRQKGYSVIVSSEAAVNLVLSLILVQKYGIRGVAIGTTIPLLITSLLIIPIYSCRVMNIRLSRYMRIMGGVVAFGTIVYFGNWLIIRNMISNSYSSIIILGIPTAAFFLLSNVFVLLTKEERKLFNIPV